MPLVLILRPPPFPVCPMGTICKTMFNSFSLKEHLLFTSREKKHKYFWGKTHKKRNKKLFDYICNYILMRQEKDSSPSFSISIKIKMAACAHRRDITVDITATVPLFRKLLHNHFIPSAVCRKLCEGKSQETCLLSTGESSTLPQLRLPSVHTGK